MVIAVQLQPGPTVHAARMDLDKSLAPNSLRRDRPEWRGSAEGNWRQEVCGVSRNRQRVRDQRIGESTGGKERLALVILTTGIANKAHDQGRCLSDQTAPQTSDSRGRRQLRNEYKSTCTDRVVCARAAGAHPIVGGPSQRDDGPRMTRIERIFADHFCFVGRRTLLPRQGAIASVAEDEEDGPAMVDPRPSA